MVLDRGIPWKILAGEATQVRRVVDDRAPGYRVRQGKRGQSRQQVRPFQPHIGLELPLQKTVRRDGRDTSETVGYAKVADFRIEQHGAISFLDVRASGYKTTADYKAGWIMLHDRAWVRALGENVVTADFSARFDDAHGEKNVYVLKLEPVRERRGRFLAADPGSVEADYVDSASRAMRGELEAVDADTLQAFAKANHDKPKVTQREVWRDSRQDIERAIERLKAAEPGRNVFSSIRSLERQLDRLDQKLDRAA